MITFTPKKLEATPEQSNGAHLTYLFTILHFLFPILYSPTSPEPVTSSHHRGRAQSYSEKYASQVLQKKFPRALGRSLNFVVALAR